jgi:type II secretory ATPase GspE/PulE/Tfp pilus assembly ATPase PilB-like protein
MAKSPTILVKPQELSVPVEALTTVTREIAERHHVCPVDIADAGNGMRRLTLAMTDTDNTHLIRELQRQTCCLIEPVAADARDIKLGIAVHYSYTAPTRPTHGHTGESPGAVRLVENIIQQAIEERATDIHLEPQAKNVFVRFRIDGFMCDHMRYDLALHQQVISRIKILSNLDIAQTRVPQDGRFDMALQQRTFDIRVSIVQIIAGEKAVLRLLPKGEMALGISQLGLSEQNQATLHRMIHQPFGMVLATGPTGSGKTTTLYACLSTINCVVKNVITVEDPVEYQFPRVGQIQIHPKIGVTFATGLRAILRQDPDIILVGEIRDLETLEIAIHASLTGHMVLTTLHCNDAAAGASRMVDMGAEAFLVASSVSCFIAQRLVRKLCVNCKEEARVNETVRRQLALPDDGRPYYQAKGCSLCRGTGYLGRMGIYEIVPMLEPIQNAILRKNTTSTIRAIIHEHGIASLHDDGLEKARAGITSLEEVIRAVNVDLV